MKSHNCFVWGVPIVVAITLAVLAVFTEEVYTAGLATQELRERENSTILIVSAPRESDNSTMLPVVAPSSTSGITASQTAIPSLAVSPSSVPSPSVRSHNGISEGDIIISELTYYDICEKCCGKTDGITASGLRLHNGMDDPHIVSCNWLPLGSAVEINGIEYIVADRGGRGLNVVGRLDVYTPEGHKAALHLGRKKGIETMVTYLP